MPELNEDKIKLAILENNNSERKVSDELYAKKIIEKIVLGFITVLVMAVVYGLGNLVTSYVERALTTPAVEPINATEIQNE